jgi:alpha-amylase
MTKVLKEPKTAISKSTAEKILSPVPYANGFHFFTSIGVYTGETAISLEHFTKEIQTIPLESIQFHIKRGDFQEWIASILGDEELAEAIGRIEAGLSGEPLRKRILKVINARITELESQFQDSGKIGSVEGSE